MLLQYFIQKEFFSSKPDESKETPERPAKKVTCNHACDHQKAEIQPVQIPKI